MRIEPIRREALRPVLGELGGFVQDSEPEHGHQIVVVLLGLDEIRNADADVVDKSGPGKDHIPEWFSRASSVVNGRDRGQTALPAVRLVEAYLLVRVGRFLDSNGGRLSGSAPQSSEGPCGSWRRERGAFAFSGAAGGPVR